MSGVPPTKRSVIVDELRRQILSGTLPRGSRLPQDDLARRFGASITPVREALSELQAEGLVVAADRRGVRVAGVDLQQVTATYVVRRLTETYALQRATLRLSRIDLARAREILERPCADEAELRERNRAFHFHFYERCGMPALTERIAATWQAFPWDLTLGSGDREDRSREEHLEILAAVEEGDLDRVARAGERHLANGFASILQQLTGSDGPDPFDLGTG